MYACFSDLICLATDANCLSSLEPRAVQDRYVRVHEVQKVALRIGVNEKTASGKAAVCRAFKDLIKACSWTSFVVRSPSFTDEGLRVLQKSERAQVCSRCCGRSFR